MGRTTPEPDVHRRKDLEFTVDLERDLRASAELLAEGLLHGGLVGAGMAIDARETQRLVFSRRLSVGQGLPDAGELRLESTEAGCRVVCQLRCGGLRRRRLFISALVGGLTATLGTLAFGWLLAVSAPVAGVAAVLADVLGWRRDRRELRRRVETYLHNSAYLKTL